jgi:hypothetical protein
MYWSSSSGRIELQITKAQALSAAHSGECDADVLALSKVPTIARQLKKIDSETLQNELREYGAWDATELQDHDQNLQRLLWCACCDIRENQ